MIDHEELLDQADRLLASEQVNEVDIRRAISSAYYAVFHRVAKAAADEFVGPRKRRTPRYLRIYRSIDHVALRSLCARWKTKQAADNLKPLFPMEEWGINLPRFADAVVALEEKRKLADYDPTYEIGLTDAKQTVRQAREAVRWFDNIKPLRLNTFLVLLCFPDRKQNRT